MNSIFPLISEGALLAAALFGLVYGIIKFFKPGVALFNQIIVCGYGCLFLGQLLTVIRLISGNSIRTFHLGMLAPIGFYFFLFSANYGQMDSLLDKKVPGAKKYGTISYILPVLIVIAYVFILLCRIDTVLKVVYAVGFLTFGAASYYNFKHAIYPDVEDGILKSIRKYNWLALAMAILNIVSITALCYGNLTVRGISVLLSALVCALILPTLRKEAEKWYL